MIHTSRYCLTSRYGSLRLTLLTLAGPLDFTLHSQTRLELVEATRQIREEKAKVYAKNDPYSQVCQGELGHPWYEANLCREFWSKSPDTVTVLGGYHAILSRSADSWYNVTLCDDDTTSFGAQSGRYSHNHHAMLSQLAKWMYHLLLMGTDAKSSQGCMDHTCVLNSAMITINKSISSAERSMDMIAEQEAIKSTGSRTLSEKAKKKLAAQKTSMWSNGNCTAINRNLIIYIIDLLAMFTTIDSTTMKKSVKNHPWVQSDKFKTALQHNSKFWWWFFYKVIRGGFRGEQFLNSNTYPAFVKLGAFNQNPYYSLLRRREKWLGKARRGIMFSWNIHVNGVDGTKVDTTTLIWGHQFFLLSLVDPQLYIRDRKILKNYTHLPTMSRTHLRGELEAINWKDKMIPELSPPDVTWAHINRAIYKLQDEYTNWCKQYLWAEWNSNTTQDDCFCFFGGAWQDFFTYHSKGSIGRGGTRLRWRSEMYDDMNLPNVNAIDELRKVMYPDSKKSKKKRSYAKFDPNSSSDESDTEKPEDSLQYEPNLV